MDFIKDVWQKIVKFFSKMEFVPTRFKIFNQILIVIFLMFLIIVIQATMNIRMLNTTYEQTRTLFSGSIDRITDASLLKSSMLQAKLSYYETLRGDSVTPISGAFFNDLIVTVDSFYQLDETLAASIDAEFSNVQDLCVNQPVTPENYNKLTVSVQRMTMWLDSLERTTMQNALMSMNASTEYSNSSRMASYLVAIIGVLVAVALALLIARSISRPLRKVVLGTQELATGNLKTEFDATVGSREVRNMTAAMETAVGSLRDLIMKIDEQAETLLVAGVELKDAAADTGNSANQVSRAMEELAKASSDQSEQINQAIETINMLATLVRKVSSGSEQMTVSSEKLAEDAKVGQKATDVVIQQIDDFYDTTKNVADLINKMDEESEEISEITDMIQAIADQTTLLALNAAIEAARAGEHGKGFNVVSKETSKLAEQSKSAAKLIDERLRQMRQRNKGVVNAMQKGVAKIEKGKSLASDAGKTFESILKSLLTNLQQIEELTVSARQMASSNEEVISAISAIAAIAEETLASTEEVSATAMDQTASNEQVTALAENLTEIANQLKHSVSQFEV